MKRKEEWRCKGLSLSHLKLIRVELQETRSAAAQAKCDDNNKYIVDPTVLFPKEI